MGYHDPDNRHGHLSSLVLVAVVDADNPSDQSDKDDVSHDPEEPCEVLVLAFVALKEV